MPNDKNRLYTVDDIGKDSKDIAKKRTSQQFSRFSTASSTSIAALSLNPPSPAVQIETNPQIGIPINDSYGSLGGITQIIPLDVYGTSYSIITVAGDIDFAFQGLPKGRHTEFTLDLLINVPEGEPLPIINLTGNNILNPPTLPPLENGMRLILHFEGVNDATGLRFVYLGGTVEGSGIIFPINYPEKDAVRIGAITLVLDFTDTDRHSSKYTITDNISFVFNNPPANKTATVFMEIVQDETGEHSVLFLNEMVNREEVEAGIKTGANETTIVRVVWLFGVFYGYLEGISSGIVFPINYPELDGGSLQNITQIIDFEDTNRHSRKYSLEGDVTFAFDNPPTDKTATIFIQVVQDSTGGHTVSFPAGTINKDAVEEGIKLGADETTIIRIVYFFGVFYAYLEGINFGLVFPINFPERDVGTLGNITQILDFEDKDRHSRKYTLNGGISFVFNNPPTDKTATVFIEVVQDATGGHIVLFLNDVVNKEKVEEGIRTGANESTIIRVVWLFGVFYAYLEGIDSGITFPINYPELDGGNLQNITQILDFEDENRHSRKYTLLGDVTFAFDNPPANKTATVFIQVVQDGVGGHSVGFPNGTVNKDKVEAGIKTGANETTIIRIVYFFGVFYAYLEDVELEFEFPINFPERDVGRIGGLTLILDFADTDRHSRKYTLTDDIHFAFINPPTDKTATIFIQIVQDGGGGHTVTLPPNVVNGVEVGARIKIGGSQTTIIKIVYFFGVFYAYLEGGGARADLSNLIETSINKDLLTNGGLHSIGSETNPWQDAFLFAVRLFDSVIPLPYIAGFISRTGADVFIHSGGTPKNVSDFVIASAIDQDLIPTITTRRDIGSLALAWDDIYAQSFRIIPGSSISTTTNMIFASTSGMIFNTTSNDAFDFRANNVEILDISLDRIQFRGSGRLHSIEAGTEAIRIMTQSQADRVELWTGARTPQITGQTSTSWQSGPGTISPYTLNIFQDSSFFVAGLPVGQIFFTGEGNQVYGGIIVNTLDVSSGAEDGRVDIIVGSAGTTSVGVSIAGDIRGRPKLGFFGKTAVSQPQVNGNLSDLIDALVDLGLVRRN